MLFGAKWTPAIPLLMILMLSQSMASTNATSAFLLKGSGRFRTWLVWQTAQTSLFVIALIIAAKFGSTITVAWVVFGQFVVFAPIGVYLCLRGHGTIRDIIRIYAVPYISCAPFVLVGIGSYMVGASWLALFIWCPLALVVGGGIYILGLRLLDKSRYEEANTLMDKQRGDEEKEEDQEQTTTTKRKQHQQER